MSEKIKLIAVDDSFFFRTLITSCLIGVSDFELIKCVANGEEALRAIAEYNPQIVLTDVNMPDISGIDLVKRVMKTNPCAFVLMSSASLNVFDALSAGAVDFINKPNGSGKDSVEQFKHKLISILRTAAMAKIPKVKSHYLPGTETSFTSNLTLKKSKFKCNLVAIGASTGGTEAIAEIMAELPSNFPGIIIVQHMPKDFTRLFAQRLDKISSLNVEEATDMARIMPGKALVAPGGVQITVKRDVKGYYVKLGNKEKISGHCPSVDNLFNSVAITAKSDSIGVILTGMGKDGAAGLLNMKNNGAYTIGQDELSSVVYGMPMEAYKIGAVMSQLPCDKIAKQIVKHLNS